MFDIIIIGSGIAGLTAALYGARAGKSILLLESNSFGGQIINSNVVENYPGFKSIDGFSLMKNLFSRASILCDSKYSFAALVNILSNRYSIF